MSRLYIYNDMTYIYIYIGVTPPKRAMDTLDTAKNDTSTLHGRRMLYAVCHWTFAPNVRVYTTHTTLAYPPPPVSAIHHMEVNYL